VKRLFKGEAYRPTGYGILDKINSLRNIIAIVVAAGLNWRHFAK
jgi:hypothetical protein